MSFKYIVFYGDKQLFGVVFPRIFSHNKMFEHMRHLCSFEHGFKATAISAGFAELEDFGFRVFGESETLRLRSRPKDAAVLNSFGHKIAVDDMPEVATTLTKTASTPTASKASALRNRFKGAR